MTEIESAVREWARGTYPTEAGVELLIRQGRAIYKNAPWITENESTAPRMASIDVDALLDASGAWSGGEQRIVRIAASLLGGPPIRLDDEVSGIDRKHLELVLAAIAHANGSHEHGDFERDESGHPIGFRRLETAYPWPGRTTTQARPRGTAQAPHDVDEVTGTPGVAPTR